MKGIFREAVEAIDAGDVDKLDSILARHPHLLRERLDEPTDGYFATPWSLWFVAENPVRNNHLPENITAVTQLIIDRLKAGRVGSMQQQLDYTLALVCIGRVSREYGLQIPLIDTLVDAGADPNAGVPPALPHGEMRDPDRANGGSSGRSERLEATISWLRSD